MGVLDKRQNMNSSVFHPPEQCVVALLQAPWPEAPCLSHGCSTALTLFTLKPGDQPPYRHGVTGGLVPCHAPVPVGFFVFTGYSASLNAAAVAPEHIVTELGIRAAEH